MNDSIKYKDHKDKIRNKVDYNKFVTTNKELKGFTKQVEDQTFGDKHFEKAYESFKRPAYGAKEERDGESKR